LIAVFRLSHFGHRLQATTNDPLVRIVNDATMSIASNARPGGAAFRRRCARSSLTSRRNLDHRRGQRLNGPGSATRAHLTLPPCSTVTGIVDSFESCGAA